MKLVTRLSLFFLTALAVVLVAMSASIYLIIRSHLVHELSERFDDTVEILASVAEVRADGVHWDPTDRRLDFGHDPGGDTVAWQVDEPSGRRVAISDQEFASLFAAVSVETLDEPIEREITWHGATWRVWRRKVMLRPGGADAGAGTLSDQEARGLPSGLIVSVAIPWSNELAPLRALILFLAGVSLSVWLVSAMIGKWLCRKALAPLDRMAQAARGISASDFGRRLPSPDTHDELQSLAQAFNELLDRLQISFQRQQRFTAEASHQLRTPLTAMLGQVDVALRRRRTSEEYLRTLESVQKQAEQLKQIIEMLLFLVREDSEAAPPQLECLELGSWVTDQLGAWERHPRAADLHFDRRAGDTYRVDAHSGLLGQAFHNLLDNALRYSRPGSPVIIQIAEDRDEIRVSVVDHGQGIAADELPRVFQPFFRSTAARQKGIAGNGLGLAIAQRIVVALRGRLAVESRPNVGSSFAMVFPKSSPDLFGQSDILISHSRQTNVDEAEANLPAAGDKRDRSGECNSIVENAETL